MLSYSAMTGRLEEFMMFLQRRRYYNRFDDYDYDGFYSVEYQKSERYYQTHEWWYGKFYTVYKFIIMSHNL